MPQVYSHVEYANMHLLYGEFRCNANAAARAYQERYPNVRHPDHRVFIHVHNAFSEGRMPGAGVGGNAEGRPRRHHDDDVLDLVTADPAYLNMSKQAKEDSGFGFKDKAKAIETLRLLEEHDVNYQRLTVRGLLGRAKRVLSLTKAEEKLKNIREAMDVFEEWLENKAQEKATSNGGKKKTAEEAAEKNDKKTKSPDDDDAPADTVPGLGFKDKATAEASLEELEGRDSDYQALAVKGLVSRAKRVLTCTKDETKLSNIREAIAVFEKFLDNFEKKHMKKQNYAYLSLDTVRSCVEIADKRKVSIDHQKSFVAAYEKVHGEYKKLRTLSEKEGEKTWDIIRNKALKKLLEKNPDPELFDDDDAVTDEHLQMLLWAYSPSPALVKKHIKPLDVSEKQSERKRKSSGESATQSKRRK